MGGWGPAQPALIRSEPHKQAGCLDCPVCPTCLLGAKPIASTSLSTPTTPNRGPPRHLCANKGTKPQHPSRVKPPVKGAETAFKARSVCHPKTRQGHLCLG